MRGIAQGVITLKQAFAEPPYALAVGHEAWLRIMSDANSYPLRRRIEELIGGPIVLSHSLKEAVLVPYKHDDLELTLGSDLAIGYESHTGSAVRLYITETFTFRILDPAIIVRYAL